MDLSWQKPAIPSGVCCSKAPTIKVATLFARRRDAYSSTEMARSSSGDSTKDHGSVSSANRRKFQSVPASCSVNNLISTRLPLTARKQNISASRQLDIVPSETADSSATSVEIHRLPLERGGVNEAELCGGVCGCVGLLVARRGVVLSAVQQTLDGT